MNGEADLNIRRLRIFLAVADAMHFGHAAESLGITQPSVSQQIAKLESEVGRPLFHRDPLGVRLTDTGEELVAAVGPAVRSLDAALRDFRSRQSFPGRVRIGMLSSLATGLIGAAVPSLIADGVAVQLAEGSLVTLVKRLRDREMEVLFCYSTDDPDVLSGLEARELDRRPVSVAMRCDDPLAEGTSVDWDRLSGRPWVLPTASRQYREDMVGRFTRRGLELRVAAEASTMAGQLLLVASGAGLTFVSPWAALPATVTLRPVEAAEELALLAVTRGVPPPRTAGVIESVARQLSRHHAIGGR